MTCRHPDGYHFTNKQLEAHFRRLKENQRKNPQMALEGDLSPDPDRYEIVLAEVVGEHLVMRIRYPSCAKCAYEGEKVMVFLHTSALDALRWKRIDPHFRGPGPVGQTEAPSPDARFPASEAGWTDAVTYARGKVV